MFKNRFLFVLGLLLVLLITMAISRPFASAPITEILESNRLSDYHERHPGLNAHAEAEGLLNATGDFYQRHPDWRITLPNIAVPVTGDSEYLDYHQRHPEPDVEDAGRKATLDSAESNTSIDECFDVSLSEVAACREASQSASQ